MARPTQRGAALGRGKKRKAIKPKQHATFVGDDTPEKKGTVSHEADTAENKDARAETDGATWELGKVFNAEEI